MKPYDWPTSRRMIRPCAGVPTRSVGPFSFITSLPARFRTTPRSAAAAESAAAAGTERRGFWTRFIYREAPAAELIFVELADRLLRFGVGSHFHESKTPC